MVRTDGVKFDIDYQCLFGEEPSRAHQALMSLTPLRADAEWLTCVGEENKQLVKTVMDITYKMMRRHAGGFLIQAHCKQLMGAVPQDFSCASCNAWPTWIPNIVLYR